MADIGGGSCGASEEFVDRVEEGPSADRFDGDITIEFTHRSESGFFTFGDRVFEPVPVFGGSVAEDKAGLAIGVIAIPGSVTECLIDAGAVEAAHEGCNRHARGGRGGDDIRP